MHRKPIIRFLGRRRGDRLRPELQTLGSEQSHPAEPRQCSQLLDAATADSTKRKGWIASNHAVGVRCNSSETPESAGLLRRALAFPFVRRLHKNSNVKELRIAPQS